MENLFDFKKSVVLGWKDSFVVKGTSWLLFQRTQVQFPVLMWQLTAIYNTSSRNLVPSYTET